MLRYGKWRNILKTFYRIVSMLLLTAIMVTNTVFADNASETAVETSNISFNRAGHIYPINEKIVFSLTEKNTSNSAVNVTYAYGYTTTETPENSSFFEKKISFSANEEKKIVFELENPNTYGIYKIKISKTEEVNGITVEGQVIEDEFSVCIHVQSGDENLDYGICQHVVGHNIGRQDTTSLLVKNAGIKIVRDSYRWQSAEKEKGVLVFDPAIKEKFSAMHDEGLKIIMVCGLGNSLYTGEDLMTAPATPEAIAGYARYCAFLAKELKGIVDYFEIWNEYNYTPFNVTNETPENYAKILKAAYTAIKEVNPEATVLGLSMGGVYPKWVQRVFAAGGYDYMDAVSLHPYEYTNVFDEVKLIDSINSIKDIMRTYEKGDSIKPVWYTEIGFSTYNGDTGFSEEHQAKNTVLSYAVSKAYDLADKYIQYTVYDNDNIADKESCWGIVRAPESKQYVPSGAKPCYLAVAAMNSFIGGNTEYKGIVANGRYYAFNFYNSRRNKNVMLIQSYQGEKSVKYNLGCNTVDVYDMYGNKTKRLYSDNGIYEFCVGEIPQYVIGKFSSFAETLSASKAVQIPYSEVNTNQSGDGNVGSYNITITDNASNPIENAKLRLYCGRLFVTLPDSVSPENISGINVKVETEEFTPANSVDIVIYNASSGENSAYAAGVTDEDGKAYISFDRTTLICNESLDKYTSLDEMYQNGWQTGEWGNNAVLNAESGKGYAELKGTTDNVISLKYSLPQSVDSGCVRIESRMRFSSDTSGFIELVPDTLTTDSDGVQRPLGVNLLTFTKGQFQTLLTGSKKFLSLDASEWYDIMANLNLNSKTYDIQVASGGNIIGAYRDVPLEIQDYTNVLGTVDSLRSVRFRCWNGKTDVAALKIERVLNNAQSMVMTSENFDGITYGNAKNHGLANPFGVLDKEIASFVKPDNRSSSVVCLNGDKHLLKEFTPVSKGRYRLSYTVLSGNGRFFVEVNDDGNCTGDGGLLLPYAEKGKLYYIDSTTNTVKVLESAKIGAYVTFECILDFDNKKTTFSAWETDTGRRLGGEVTVDGLNEDKGKELSALKYLHILKWYDSYPGYFDDVKLEYIGGESTVPVYNVTFVDYKGNEIGNAENINAAIQKIVVDTDNGFAAYSLVDSISLSKANGAETVNTECSLDEQGRIVVMPKTMLETNTEYILTVPNIAAVSGNSQNRNFEFMFKTGAVLQSVVNESLDRYSAIDEMYQNGWQTGEWGNKAVLNAESGKGYAELKGTTNNVISLKYSLTQPEDSGCVRVESRVRFSSDASGFIELVPDTLTTDSDGVQRPLGVTLLTYSKGTMQTQLMGGRKFLNYIPDEWYYITATLNFDTKSYDMQITNNGNVIGAYRGVPLEIQNYTTVLGAAENLANIRYRCWGGKLDVGDLKIERVLKGTPSITVSSENFNDVTFDTAKNHGISTPFGDTLDSLVSFDKPNDYSSAVLNFNAFDKHIIKEFTPISSERYRISYKEKINGQRMFVELRKNSINDNSKKDNGNIILPYSGVNGNLYYYDNDLKEGKKFGAAAMNSWVEFVCDIDFGAGTITYSANDASTGAVIGGTITKPLLDTNGDMLDMARYFHLSSWGRATLYFDDFSIEYVSDTPMVNPAKWVVKIDNITTDNGMPVKRISDLKTGGKLTVNTEILNTEDNDKELWWIVAYYKNDTCKSVDCQKGIALAEAGMQSAQTFTVPSDISDTDTVKVMLWNNAEKMFCYCESAVIK